MKAVIFHENGGPDVLRYEDVADPIASSGEIVVRVRACGVNRGLDIAVRDGTFGPQGFSLPHVSGADPAGEVVAVRPGASQPRIGTRVVVYPVISCGRCDLCVNGPGGNYCRAANIIGVQRWGGYAEYLAMPAANAIPLPDSVAFVDAVALPVSYGTAWHGLIRKARLAAGDVLLVTAAGSGIGAAAIDIGRFIGARVLAVAGAEWKLERARALGAEYALDYTRRDWVEELRRHLRGNRVTVLFDNAGAEIFEQSIALVDRAGRVVCSGSTGRRYATLDLVTLYRNFNTLYFYSMSVPEDLVELIDHLARGRLHPVIDSVFPLANAAAAQTRLASRAAFGKVVLTV